jgi:hypothetical protein
MPMELQMDLLKMGFAVPLKIFTIVTLKYKTKNPPAQVDKKATGNLAAGELCANRIWPRPFGNWSLGLQQSFAIDSRRITATVVLNPGTIRSL